MKIVHSYWSKPNLIQKKASQNLGGWTHRAFNYMSWALSCLKFKEFYPNIELVTDQKGKELLIDRLGLPYTSVKVVSIDSLLTKNSYKVFFSIDNFDKIKAKLKFIQYTGEVQILIERKSLFKHIFG